MAAKTSWRSWPFIDETVNAEEQHFWTYQAMINGCRKTQVLTLTVSIQKGPQSIFWFTVLENPWLCADSEYMKISTHPSAVRTCVFRVRQVKHLVSVSYACQLGGEDFVSDLHRASDSYNVKLQSSVSKSLLLKKKKEKKREQQQVREESGNLTWNRSCIVSCQNKSWHNPEINTINLVMSHLQAEHLSST